MVVQLKRTLSAMQHNNSAIPSAAADSLGTKATVRERANGCGPDVSRRALHEIGNQLSVLSYAEMIRDRYPDDPEVKLFTSAIPDGARGSVVWSRKSRLFAGARQPASAGRSAREFIHVFRRRRAGGELDPWRCRSCASILEFDSERLPKSCRPGGRQLNRDKLVQVLNLLRNALDATAGQQHQRARAVRSTFDDPAQPQAGHGSCVQIDDYGDGIPSDMPRILNPFHHQRRSRPSGLGLGHADRSIVRTTWRTASPG